MLSTPSCEDEFLLIFNYALDTKKEYQKNLKNIFRKNHLKKGIFNDER